ncbi:MAG: DUF4105 domain-containing protein [Sphaerochaetaceae bacterium]
MKKIMAMALAFICLVNLGALSMTGHDVAQPFDSQEELKKFDFSLPLTANQKEWIDQCSISVVIIGPGNPLYSWFGHAGIIIKQPNGQSIMYDYGIFDSSQKGFYLNFARGRMLYNVYVTDADWRIEDAISEGRQVERYDLNLNDSAKFQVVKFLQKNTLQENNTYLYHFYKDNCATRIRDILNSATLGDFERWARSKDSKGTFRSYAQRSLGHQKFISWYLNFLESGLIDTPITLWNEMFLPQSLGNAIAKYEPFNATCTVLNEQTDAIAFHPDTHAATDSWPYLLFGLVFSLSCVFLQRHDMKKTWKIVNFLMLLFLGISGTLLFYMMCFSDMDVTWFNESILFINPFLLFLAFQDLGKNTEKVHTAMRTLSFIMFFYLIFKGIFSDVLIQDNMRTIFVVLPYYLTGFVKDGLPGRRKAHTNQD